MLAIPNLSDRIVSIRKQLSDALGVLERRQGGDSLTVQTVKWFLDAEECRSLTLDTQYLIGGSLTHHVEDATAPIYGEPTWDDGEQKCSNPEGHKFSCTGTAYGGDDERWHGEGRCLCEYCGADGDA